MAKIKIVGQKRAAKGVLETVNQVIAESGAFKDAENFLKQEIRAGKNPKTGKNYRGLKESTISHRQYIARNNPTHPAYSPSKSNLTLTGNLVNAIQSRFDKAKGILSIFVSGNHPGYKGARGQQIQGSSKPYDEIVSALEEQKRPLLSFSNTFTQLLVKKIEQALRRLS